MPTKPVCVIVIGRVDDVILTSQEVQDAEDVHGAEHICGCEQHCQITRVVLYGENVSGGLEAFFVPEDSRKPAELHVFSFNDRVHAKAWLDAMRHRLEGKEIFLIDQSLPLRAAATASP